MSFSIFTNETRGDSGYFRLRNLSVSVEQNLSYTRVDKGTPEEKDEEIDNFEKGALNNLETNIQNNVQSRLRSGADPDKNFDRKSDSDEDARFLRLAREALVATSTESNLIVDPTIQDLLQRLQYALSPHGNPIRRSESIHANENGQLMIQSFYNGFPNLSNDVFTGSARQTQNESEWDFLMDRQSVESSGSEEPEKKRGLRKYPCLDCAMSFRRSLDLKRHEKQHLSVPANICLQCGKGFARKDALKRHAGTLTCKRNAEKRLYLKNLEYLRE